jgi:F-type H+-transporting ATPase subunit b
MESLIHAFGIDIRLITIQIINFVVLAGALSYFLYKPILGILKEREEKIKQGVEDAKAAGEAKERADTERKEIVGAAHLEAEAVSRRAEEHAKEKASELVRAAESEAADKLRIAGEKAEALAAEAKSKSEAEVAKLAVLAVEKLVSEKS